MATQGTKKRAARSTGSSEAGSSTGADPGVRGKILAAFSAHIAEEGHAPRSVAKFCRELGITEVVFYRHFPSLHAVEKAFWRDWMAGVIGAVESGAEWAEFTARERYLAFLFALIQAATERRSLMDDLNFLVGRWTWVMEPIAKGVPCNSQAMKGNLNYYHFLIILILYKTTHWVCLTEKNGLAQYTMTLSQCNTMIKLFTPS